MKKIILGSSLGVILLMGLLVCLEYIQLILERSVLISRLGKIKRRKEGLKSW